MSSKLLITDPPITDPLLTGRLVTLSTGASGLRSTLSVQSTPVPIDGAIIADGVLDFRSSDETLDRYDEIISAAGWQLDNYRKNPVVQNAHQYGDIIHTIGRSLITEVRSSASNDPADLRIADLSSQPFLFQRVQFAVDANPIAALAYKLYKGKFLRAVSVGFIPLAYDKPKEGDNFYRRYTSQELLEVSAVGIPANPNALELAVKSGALIKSDLRELAQFLKHFCSEQAASRPNSRAQGTGDHGAQHEQIANLLNQVTTHLRKS
jgi:Caudovirus prohead serine protease